MPSADGYVNIVAKMDVDDAERELRNLDKEMLKLEKDKAVKSAYLEGVKKQSAEVSEKLDSARKELQRLDDAFSGGYLSDEFKDMAQYNDAMDKQKEIVQQLEAEQKSLNKEEKKYSDALEHINSELEVNRQLGAAAQQAVLEKKVENALIEEQAKQAEEAEAYRHSIEGLNEELDSLLAKQRELQSYGLGWGLGRERRSEINAELEAVSHRIEELHGELRELEEESNRAGDGLRENFRNAGRSIDESSSFLDKFTNRVKGLMKRVFIFSVITAALRSMRTWFSKAIKSNDEASAAIARFKGALLTLAQPLVQVIIPAFTMLVNILTAIIGKIAAFMAALFGTTSRQAAEAAKDLYEEQQAIEGVGGAAKEAAGSLAGFDEINTISTESTGGGGGAATNAPDFSWADGVTDTLSNIADLILAIGAALLTWKIARGFGAGLRTALGLAIGIFGLVVAIQGYLDAWRNGIDWGNLTDTIAGLTLFVVGLAIAFGKLGAEIGLVISGIALLVLAFKDASENGWNLKNTLSAVIGILAIGIGAFLLGAGAIAIVIAAVIALLLAITVATGHGEELIDGFREFLEGFKDFFVHIFSGEIDEALTSLVGAFSGLKQACTAVIDGLRDGFDSFFVWLDEKTDGKLKPIIDGIRWFFSEAFDAIESRLGIFIGYLEFFWKFFSLLIYGFVTGDWDPLWGHIKQTALDVANAIKDAWVSFTTWLDENIAIPMANLFAGMWEDVTGLASSAVEGVKSAWSSITTWFYENIIQPISGFFSGLWQGIVDIVNGILEGIEGKLNTIVRTVNGLAASMESALSFDWSLPEWMGGASGHVGISLPRISEIKLPRLAQGAVIPPNREFMAVLGDQKSGTNVEAPLSTIEQALQNVFDRNGGGVGDIHITLELDGKVVARSTVKHINDMTRSSGKPVLVM